MPEASQTLSKYLDLPEAALEVLRGTALEDVGLTRMDADVLRAVGISDARDFVLATPRRLLTNTGQVDAARLRAILRVFRVYAHYLLPRQLRRASQKLARRGVDGHPKKRTIPEGARRSDLPALVDHPLAAVLLSRLERSVAHCFRLGMSYREICRQLGCSEKSVDNALRRATLKLHQLHTLAAGSKALGEEALRNSLYPDGSPLVLPLWQAFAGHALSPEALDALEAVSLAQHFDGCAERALQRVALAADDSAADLSRLTLGYVACALRDVPSDLELVLTTYEEILGSVCGVPAQMLRDCIGADRALAPELTTDSAGLLSVWVLPLCPEVCYAFENAGIESVSQLASANAGRVLGMPVRRALALRALFETYGALESVSAERLDRMAAVFRRGARQLLVESAKACGWEHAERDVGLLVARARVWRGHEDITYEVLGKRLGVSRERVRQMLNRVAKNRWGRELASTIGDLALPFVGAVRRARGLVSAQDLVGGDANLWPLSAPWCDEADFLILACGQLAVWRDLLALEEKWSVNQLQTVADAVVGALQSEGEPMATEQLAAHPEIAATGVSSGRQLDLVARAEPRVGVTADGAIALAAWGDQFPRSQPDRVHAVIAGIGRPAHVAEIHAALTHRFAEEAETAAKRVYTQLSQARGGRFARYGKATYGLLRWRGNPDRVIADHAAALLSRVGGPLSFEGVVLRVARASKLSQRQVKNTLSANAKLFQMVGLGSIDLAERHDPLAAMRRYRRYLRSGALGRERRPVHLR